jgi:lipopolysaccharide assembly outer membrane protein LptD (OstA)
MTPIARALAALAVLAATSAQTPSATPSPAPASAPPPAAASAPPSAAPSPEQTGVRIHLHRPGTDVDADRLTGNLGTKVYEVSGHVVVHDNPSVDRNSATAQTESSLPIILHAERMSVDETAKKYEAQGDVQFEQGDRRGSADMATLDDMSHDLTLKGNAKVSEGDRTLSADAIHYNTASKAFDGSGNVEIISPAPTAGPGASPAPRKKKSRLPGLPL